MKMQLLFTILSFLACLLSASGQSFSELKKGNGENPFKEDRIKLFGRFTAVSSKYTPSYSGVTINIGVSRNEYGKGETRLRYENPTLGDLIQGVPRAIKDIKGIVNDEQTDITVNKWDDHAHGGGFLGWMQLYMNAVAKDRLLISPGISLGDYIYGSRYAKPSGNKGDQDPYGYFFAAGPSLLSSFVLGDFGWLDAYVTYDIAFAKVNNRGTKEYPKPHFLSIGADFHTTSKLFIGARLHKLKDKGDSKDASSRLDLSAGILF